mmetsp:Transcript_5570/g.16363  ORF Transcript_5570/g.16363 Transcript_5570/m.16363 type:complete len:235 (+) Transcript_5570:488-1192(+)
MGSRLSGGHGEGKEHGANALHDGFHRGEHALRLARDGLRYHLRSERGYGGKASKGEAEQRHRRVEHGHRLRHPIEQQREHSAEEAEARDLGLGEAAARGLEAHRLREGGNEAKERKLLRRLPRRLPEAPARVDALVGDEAPQRKVIEEDNRAQQPHRKVVPQHPKGRKRVGAAQQLGSGRRRWARRLAHRNEGEGGVEEREEKAAAKQRRRAEMTLHHRSNDGADEVGAAHADA